MTFDVTYLEEARNFLKNLPDKDQDKVLYNIDMVKSGNRDDRLFKKLNDTIYEFRTDYNGNAYRLLSFWDTKRKSMVVATHGFSKKTQKTPLKEITKAEKIRERYLKN